ncbi:uncharacterized protein MONOS_116 [Monocercomonoides exilis]|uniref:uncharacterized protein n=1 Tax=Monocercomonoides exilis TaxID=2049356 RepID=UPI003559ADB4|nr:hypothetical protein MONOS_116 [Monocercomonoides exilis]|eukprot:MONOS_116.1-p1 / transcript=MONOS_116.1 / gene=MONOS_116 / organism=Monocercomonoides_exilis_PA203 / gene_product=unspecified product / transcript_product=unspecified product / location=Mono_scaffold00002:182029-185111(+) / protein_length=972 / sequence_SO=supercontig / SO=protein_coding / is_pseudo=false
MKYRGTIDVIPARILHTLLNAGYIVLYSANSEKEVGIYGSILEIILNPESFSENFRSLNYKNIAVNSREQYIFECNQDLRRTIAVSQFQTSPLLHEVIKDGKLIPAIVIRINAAENDETLTILGKLLFHLVSIAGKTELLDIVNQGLFEGIQTILVQCNLLEGIHIALNTILHFMTKLDHVTFQPYEVISKKLKEYCLKFALLEIVMGMRKRIQSFEKYVKDPQIFDKLSLELGEEAVMKEYFMISDVRVEDKEKQIEKPEAKKTNEPQTKNNKRKQTGAKRSQKMQKTKTSNDEDVIIIDDEQNASIHSASSPTEEHSSDPSTKEDEQYLPLPLRLEAAHVFFLFEGASYMDPLQWKILSVLSEGLKLPDGVEDKYFFQKMEELKVKKNTKEEEMDSESSDEEEKEEEKRKRIAKYSSILKGKTELGEQENASDDDDDYDNSDAKVFADIDSYFNCEKSIPLTPYDTTDFMKQIQKTLLTIAHCLKKAYEVKSEGNIRPAQDQLIITLKDRLSRIMNFPLNRFYTLAGCCIELLFMVMPDSALLRCLPSVEKQIVADLPLIEKEMAEANLQKQPQLTFSRGMRCYLFEGDAESNKLCKAFPNDLCLTSFEPDIDECLTGSDYDVAQKYYMEALSFGFTVSLHQASKVLFNNRSTFLLKRLDDTDQSIQPYHYSLTAYRFNHNMNCIISAIVSSKKNADLIVLRPFFGFLVNKISRRFRLCAPMHAEYPPSSLFYPSSLESVPIMISFVVATVLVSVLKELPFAFEMGYILSLADWMADQTICSQNFLTEGILKIREACLVYALPSRILRLMLIEPINKEIQKIKKKPDLILRRPIHYLFDRWGTRSNLEKEECIPQTFSKPRTLLELEKYDGVHFPEDEEEVEKEDDSGTVLYCKLEDALEESGIHDLIEAVPQEKEIDPFWQGKRTMPIRLGANQKYYFNHNEHNMRNTRPNLRISAEHYHIHYPFFFF